jgi:hypothetical protein
MRWMVMDWMIQDQRHDGVGWTKVWRTRGGRVEVGRRKGRRELGGFYIE